MMVIESCLANEHVFMHVSYPNFVRGLLLDDMRPLVRRFEITWRPLLHEVPRRIRNQKEAGLRDL